MKSGLLIAIDMKKHLKDKMSGMMDMPEEDSDYSPQEDLVAVAEEILAAVKSGNAEELASALKCFVHCIDEEEAKEDMGE